MATGENQEDGEQARSHPESSPEGGLEEKPAIKDPPASCNLSTWHISTF